jgi:hypothetical protein
MGFDGTVLGNGRREKEGRGYRNIKHPQQQDFL